MSEDADGGSEGAGNDGSRRKSSKSQKKVQARRRGLECVKGILQGKTYQEVADEQGYSSRGAVHRVVQQTLAQEQAETIDELRTLELARLDSLQRAFYPAATAGDLKAAEMVLKVMAQRSRLLQLERVGGPEPVTEHPVLVGGTKEQFLAALHEGRTQS
ncbi:hypothetical protein GCM10022415_28950 [Knoellia locipacati]|uniref:Uncharacterized protein n=1 Tax=Knoellia locipacati TaxID=882824 RepID=A0A512T4J1_9MICO|nr:hypothetical protein [Knoellia locipacati]GEQ15134.1 hypothetical protein KLO01_31810 [Knoellia locipacati]